MNEITYKQCGDYLIPDIKLMYEEMIPLGKYGCLRREYLKNYAPILYNDLILSEELFLHLHEIDETAKKRIEILMEQLLERNPAPDKKTEQMA